MADHPKINTSQYGPKFNAGTIGKIKIVLVGDAKVSSNSPNAVVVRKS